MPVPRKTRRRESPVHSFQPFIDRDAASPVARQLYLSLRKAILTGQIRPAGTGSTRSQRHAVRSECNADVPALRNRRFLGIAQGGHHLVVKAPAVENVAFEKARPGNRSEYADDQHDRNQFDHGEAAHIRITYRLLQPRI